MFNELMAGCNDGTNKNQNLNHNFIGDRTMDFLDGLEIREPEKKCCKKRRI